MCYESITARGRGAAYRHLPRSPTAKRCMAMRGHGNVARRSVPVGSAAHGSCGSAPAPGGLTGVRTTAQRIIASRKPQAASRKPQAASRKPQAASRKPQAASRKPQALASAARAPGDGRCVLARLTGAPRPGAVSSGRSGARPAVPAVFLPPPVVPTLAHGVSDEAPRRRHRVRRHHRGGRPRHPLPSWTKAITQPAERSPTNGWTRPRSSATRATASGTTACPPRIP